MIGAAANDFSAWSARTRLPLLRRVMILRMLVGFLFFSLVEVVPSGSLQTRRLVDSGTPS